MNLAAVAPPGLEILATRPGRVVLAEPGGVLHLGRGYEVHRSDDEGRTWRRVTTLPRSPWRWAAERSRLASRLLRQEVRALVRLSGDRYVAANREGVFHGGASDRVLRPSGIEDGGVPIKPPMRLTPGPGEVVVFGEYGSRRDGRPVRLFASRDGGASFALVRAFDAGSVLHVHNLCWDEGLRHYWVLAGDHGQEPGIGVLSEDLARFEWLVKGEQRYRACAVFDFGDHLVYATDTEKEQNGLIRLDKHSGRSERLRDFEGSCIYACRFGGLYAITTTVEPSTVNRSKHAGLWISRDGERWVQAYRAEKDRWSADYFQFGSVVLPAGASDRETLFFSGQAVTGIEGRAVVARVVAGSVLDVV